MSPSVDRPTTPSRYLAVVIERLHVFVPALMGVGFAFWLGAAVRDVMRRHSEGKLERRARVAGPAVAARTRTGSSARSRVIGLRRRRTYLLWSIALVGVALYIAVVAIGNYADPTDDLSEVGWLLALLLAIAVGVGMFGGVLVIIAVRGPVSPNTRRLTATTPVGIDPAQPTASGPSPWLAGAVVAAALAAVGLAAVVDATSWLRGADERVVAALADIGWLDWVDALDPLGSTVVTVVAAALLGLASFRCRPVLLVYPAVVIAGLFANTIGRALVPRERPPDGVGIGELDSFPSGHMIQLTVLLGLLPFTLQVLSRTTHRLRLVWLAAGALVVLGGVHRIRIGAHWPSDVVAGVLIGLTLVLFARWIIGHERGHRWCHDCPWHPVEVGQHELSLGAVPIDLSLAQVFRFIAHGSAVAVSVLLAVLATTRGLPIDSEALFLDEQAQRWSQLGLAGLVSFGALVAWRSEAVGAVLLALAATGLGIFAAVQYEPLVAFGLTIVVLVPAVLLWLSWQHRRTAGEIVALAGVTLALMLVAWLGIRAVHATTLGPTHPDSTAVLASADAVEWVWSGGLRPDGIRVVARVPSDARNARLHVSRAGAPAAVVEGELEGDLARFDVRGLDADTEYSYEVEADGLIDTGRGFGSFRTAPLGPSSFTFAASSCARSDTNGAVFDAIAAEDPLVLLALGDLFYANIDRADRSLFDAAFDRHLTAPGPANLYRDVPIAYVWDDHDYGPNDSDASSPSRDTARAAFRDTVPSHDLVVPADGPIHRAFTIGRVRFVITDGRSERTDETMLGTDQLEWLIDELKAASRTHALVVWGNSTPWIGEADGSSDIWAGHSTERAYIADEIAGAGIDNLLMVSGDAHMLAFDDGSNSGYQQGGGPGFPVVQAAALDRPGSVKGGPYTGGTFPGGGQYAVFEVHDDGETIAVDVSGMTWDGELRIFETLEFTAA